MRIPRPKTGARRLRSLLLPVLAGAVLGACGDGGASRPSPDPAEVEGGARLFARYCASCHGEEGSGGKMTPPMEKIDFKFGGSREEIARTVARGRPLGMPAFGGELDDEQLRSLAVYVLSLR